MYNDPKPRRISLRFTDEEYRAIDRKRFAEQKAFQEIGEELFSSWVNEAAPEPGPHYLNMESLSTQDQLALRKIVGIVTGESSRGSIVRAVLHSLALEPRVKKH